MEKINIDVNKEISSLEEAKEALKQLHEITKNIFMWAWANNVHKELAIYTMGLKELSAEDEGNGN